MSRKRQSPVQLGAGGSGGPGSGKSFKTGRRRESLGLDELEMES